MGSLPDTQAFGMAIENNKRVQKGCNNRYAEDNQLQWIPNCNQILYCTPSSVVQWNVKKVWLPSFMWMDISICSSDYKEFPMHKMCRSEHITHLTMPHSLGSSNESSVVFHEKSSFILKDGHRGYHDTGISAALLPRCLPNFRAIGKV